MRLLSLSFGFLLAGCLPQVVELTGHRPTSIPAVPLDTDTTFVPTELLPQFDGAPPQNVLMISIDTWRRDHFDPYGDGTEYTPFLASLAAEGLRLDDHVSCSNWTYPAVTCTILGMYNLDNDFLPKIAQDYREPVPSGTRFLAGYLVEPGYYNLLVSANSWLGQSYNNAAGYHDSRPPNVQNTKLLLEKGVERLEAAVDPATDPWFLHVHLMEPHVAYKPPEEYLTELEGLAPLWFDPTENEQHYDATKDWPDMTPEQRDLLETHLRIRYRAELRYMDDQIEEVFSDLDDKGLLDNTLVVFWTDHGESFWEHGHQSHAWTLHRQENDAIAFFWSKNIVQNAWTYPTVSIDIAPTVLSILDINVPETMTGFRVGQAPPNRARFAYVVGRTDPAQSVRFNDWKMIFNWTGVIELYDLFTDPEELNNVYAPDHPMAQPLWDKLKPRVEKAVPLVPEETISWPPGLD